MNRICNTCNKEKHEKNYLKDRTVCKNCYNKNRRKNNNKTLIRNQQSKIDKINYNNDNVSTYGNHACVVIGRRNVGKTYYVLKMLEKRGNKKLIYIITRTPIQYPNYKTKNENKPINKYKSSVVLFDDMLGARNSSQIDEFYRRGRDENLNVFYVSQSHFGLPRQSIRHNSDRLILLKQTLRDVQSMYYDIAAYDMKHDEFKETCHKAWSERFNYLCIDMTKNKNDGKYRIFNGSKNTYIECICETQHF